MNLRVGKDVVVSVIKRAKKGEVSVLEALKAIFPKTYGSLDVPFPKLMIKRKNTKTGEAINRVVLFKSPTKGCVVWAGKGKYPIGYSGDDIKVSFYEDVTPEEVAAVMAG